MTSANLKVRADRRQLSRNESMHLGLEARRVPCHDTLNVSAEDGTSNEWECLIDYHPAIPHLTTMHFPEIPESQREIGGGGWGKVHRRV